MSGDILNNMVFNVIACHIQGKEESELERYVIQSVGAGSKSISEVYTVQVIIPIYSRIKSKD